MKFSKKSEYALRALVFMASHPGGLHTIPAISKAESIPPKFLEQILLSLRQNGFLISRRGAGGGYSLNKPPSQIHVLDVLQAMDGEPLLPLGASSAGNAVDLFLSELQEVLIKKIQQTTVEDLLLSVRGTDPGTFEI